MFGTLIYPSSGSCDCFDELPHRSSCSVKTDVLALVKIHGVYWRVCCDVFCGIVVVGKCILIDFDRYLLCFVTILFVCVWYFSLVVWYLVPF